MVSFRSVIFSPYGVLALSALCLSNGGFVVAASEDAVADDFGETAGEALAETSGVDLGESSLKGISPVDFLQAHETAEIPKFMSKGKEKMAQLFKKLGHATGMYEKDKCEELKKKGKKPQATDKVATVRAYGYPQYDQQRNKTVLHPRVSLSIFGNFPQPIIVNWEDFILQGSPADILSFLQCFEEYKVRALTLQPNGKWIMDKKNPLKLQAQNLATIQDTSISQMLFKRSLESIVKAIDPSGLSASNAQTVLGAVLGNNTSELIVSGVEKGKEIVDIFKSLKEYVNVDNAGFKAFYEKFIKCRDAACRIKVLLEALGGSKFLKKQQQWSDGDVIDPKKDMSLTFTAYSRPSGGVRATFVFDEPEETLGEAAEAFEALIVNTKAAKAVLSVLDKK